MLFNSFIFLAFLLVVFVLYYLPGLRRHQVVTLILGSFVFYAWNVPWLLILLVTSISVNVFLSYVLSWGPAHRMRQILTLGLVFNLLIIFFFKYAGLINRTFHMADHGVMAMIFSLPLPIGISFYTFENISLLMDLFRHRTRKEPVFITQNPLQHLKQTSLFVAFFPHLISGPILKADNFYPQIKPKYFKNIDWKSAFKCCVLGYFLKMVVADNLKDFTSNDLAYPTFEFVSPFSLLVFLFGYAIQIFADFAGYSSVAIGLGLLFGYQLPINFNCPYISRSLGEFWRRWHISLSSWLRDYLYFPLGGNRLGKARTYLNLFIVMALGGLWHGAAWSFAVWGLYHGAGLAVERWVLDVKPRLWTAVPAVVQMGIVFAFVAGGWLLFKLPNFQQALEFIRCVVHPMVQNPVKHNREAAAILLFSLPVILYHFAAVNVKFRDLLSRQDTLVFGGMLAAIVISQGLPGAFIYFQF